MDDFASLEAEYELGAPLGEGGFAVVRTGRARLIGHPREQLASPP